MSMLCPKCKKKTKVEYTYRESDRGIKVRDHVCQHCGAAFSTFQMTASTFDQLAEKGVNVKDISYP